MGNLSYLSLTLHFVIWTSGIIADNSIRDHSTDEVTLQIISQDQEEVIVNLKKVDSFLANENLPVWIVRGNDPDKLIPDTEVMKRIGQFSMYQDSIRSSAAVYFHNLHEFYGVIDVRFILKAIRIGDVHTQFKVKTFVSHGVQERIPHQGHRRSRSVNNKVFSSVLCSVEKIGEKFDKDQSSVRTSADLPTVVYVKVLIIVNHDLLAGIRREVNGKIEIVHYLLTLFNNVDMLYSKVEEPKVKINIAGIIIGNENDSFPSLAKCNKQKSIRRTVTHYMEVHCITSAMKTYLLKHSKTISPDSYNVAIFLTRSNLRLQLPFLDVPVHGMNFDRSAGPYKTRRDGSKIVPTIAVHHEQSFGSYHTIAHEMAHALRVHSHDDGSHVDEEGNCCAYLMKEGADTCEHCLSWSPVTKERLKSFFSSHNRCFFINKPLSLEKSGLRKIWTADEQCQCYGYVSACAPKRSLMDKILKNRINNQCDRNLRCVDLNRKSHNVPFPLDGTPCSADTNNVCWNRECRAVEEHAGRRL